MQQASALDGDTVTLSSSSDKVESNKCGFLKAAKEDFSSKYSSDEKTDDARIKVRITDLTCTGNTGSQAIVASVENFLYNDFVISDSEDRATSAQLLSDNTQSSQAGGLFYFKDSHTTLTSGTTY